MSSVLAQALAVAIVEHAAQCGGRVLVATPWMAGDLHGRYLICERCAWRSPPWAVDVAAAVYSVQEIQLELDLSP